jgi:predicted nucleotidyltransferase/DNA-binding XRE family transcriptional regulator
MQERISTRGARIRSARSAAHLTQAALADLAGVTQPKLSAYERGTVEPRPDTFERVMRATRSRPSVVLEARADEVIAAAARHHISRIRVFGSSVHGTDTPLSDIDLLVSFDDRASLYDLTGFAAEAEELLGYPVDVISDRTPMSDVMRRILAEAVPL